FGGTPTLISEPTGPMTVVMTAVIASLTAGDPENGLAMAFTVVIFGGLFQILFGVLKLGKYITLIPYTVISGFMSGIGIIIILIELGPLLGHPNADSVIHSLQLLPQHIQTTNPAALGLSLLTLVIVFGTPRRINRVLPAPLLALVVVTTLSVIALPVDAVIRIGTIPTGLPFIHWPSFQLDQLKTMVGYGIMLGVLGAIDSLLTSLVADSITQTQHDSDRELIGQGIGNCLSGLFGGLPGAGATMRTVINVKSGGRTPLSGVIHAFVLLVVVLGAGRLTEVIPQPVLAGILLKVGIDIIDWSFLKRAHKLSLKAAGLMYGVMAMTVFVDLITAVAVGVFIANLLTVKRLTELQLEGMVKIDNPDEGLLLNPEEKQLLGQAKGRILLFHLGGPMSFGAAKGISQRLSIVGNYDVLILDLTDVPLMGVTASLAIENMVKEAKDKRRDVFVVGAHGPVEDRLKRLGILPILSQGSLAITRIDALQLGLELIQSRYQEREPVNL
ncbi:MAG: SulP family inorganic anion transporter, partial [Cyanobacteria bacterium]|nr:SulP family inorganic anion transporter [Cyanobacteriota bacterium]